MLTHNYTYKACLNTSSRVYWDLNELFEGESFDFTKRWLPEEWANVDGISCLTGDEKLKLNQILGYSYYYYFDFAEEFITAQIIEQVRNHRFGDETKLRAMLRFAEEEVKHQAMFQRARAMMLEGFGSPIESVPGKEEVARVVLQKSPLAVMLLVTMLEWVSQTHYLSGVRENSQNLDSFFCKILKAHWIEEAQHTKLDSLEMDSMAEALSLADREKAVDELIELGGAFDSVFGSQADLDVDNLSAAVGRNFSDLEKEEIRISVHRSYRKCFLVAALEHPQFVEIIGEMTNEGVEKIAETATALLA